MGTKIQANKCLPQCYSVMDLDGNSSNCTKSVYQDNRLLRNGQYHRLPMSEKSSNGYFKYDLEVARQTIMKHESIFRNQLQELHRLYKRQRDLMNEIKSGGLDKDHIKAEKSLSSPLFSPVPPEDAKRTWDVPHSSSLYPAIGRLSTSGPSTAQSPIGFIACKSMPVCPSFQDTGSLKNVEPIISTGMFVERTSVSNSVGNPGNVTCHVRADGSANTNLGPLTNDSIAGKMKCNGHSSIGSFCLGNSPASFQSVLAESRNEFSTHCRPDEHDSAARGKKTLFGVEISEGNGGQLGAASNMSNQNHKTDSVNSGSLYALLWTKACSTSGMKVRSLQQDHRIVASEQSHWIANSPMQQFAVGNVMTTIVKEQMQVQKMKNHA